MTATEEQILPRNTPEHTIELVSISPTRWRAVCSCGEYRSTGYAYKGRANDAGVQHVRAKGGATG